MKRTMGVVALSVLLAMTFAAVSVQGGGGRLVVSGYSLQGTALTFEVTNTSSTAVSGTFEVGVVSNGVVVETYLYPITVGGLDTIIINGTITDDLNPLEYLTFGLR
jgi:hypothetical protein